MSKFKSNLVSFYVEGSRLTFVGCVTLIGVGLSLAFLIIRLISNVLINRG